MTGEFKVPSAEITKSVVSDKLDKLQQVFETVDVTDLVTYENKVKEIGSFNVVMASHYLRDFILAIDVTNNMLRSAKLVENKAKAFLDEAKSIAYLDKASPYLAQIGAKDTVDARKAYVDRDSDVVRAKDLHAQAEALVVLLNNKLWAFRYAHDDVKKISYGDQKLTSFEGM